MVKDWLLTTPCDVVNASPETGGGTISADLDVERVSSASSQSRSITSHSSRSSSKRSSATVKAALAKLRLDQAEERLARRGTSQRSRVARSSGNWRKLSEGKWRAYGEASTSNWRVWRKAPQTRRRARETSPIIEKRRSEAKRERELELLRWRHRHKAAEHKRSILDQLSEGKLNITINHTFTKQEGVSSQFYRSVNVAGQQTPPQRPTYVCNEENVRGNQQGEEEDNVGECSKGLRDRTCTFSQRYLSRIQLLLILPNKGSEPRRLQDARLEPTLNKYCRGWIFLLW